MRFRLQIRIVKRGFKQSYPVPVPALPASDPVENQILLCRFSSDFTAGLLEQLLQSSLQPSLQSLLQPLLQPQFATLLFSASTSSRSVRWFAEQ